MKKLAVTAVIIAGMAFSHADAFAQYRTADALEETPKSESELILEEAASSEAPVIITLEQALQIALSENVSVKVADMEIQRAQYAKKGSYAALFPQIDVAGSYSRTIKKQAMYMAMGQLFSQSPALYPWAGDPAPVNTRIFYCQFNYSIS